MGLQLVTARRKEMRQKAAILSCPLMLGEKSGLSRNIEHELTE